MAPSKRYAALLDMAHQLEPNDSLDCLEKSQDVRHVLERHIEAGAPPSEMIRRIRHSQFANELLGLLGRQYRGTRHWKPFIDAVLTCDEDWFGELIEPITIGFIFKDVASLRHIAEHHAELIREEHLWTVALNWDTYWATRIREFTTTGRYRHAFCELRKARCGFFIADPAMCDEAGHGFREVMDNPANRVYALSKPILAEVATELYQTMVNAGQLPNEDLPPVWITGRRCAGMWTAHPFLKRTSDAGHGETKYFYEPAGSMILTMAKRFAKPAAKAPPVLQPSTV